ncbi:phage tail protein [Flavobacterium sp. Sd200]|uniref:phage tail protein n=1 Tax=Flavobacterium sp. Sd200 TaxID=2692211 RepID=UPI001368FC99|nr:tail fiber protein [Flavobacterium sp. Sd200]MXN90792.1 phage tail protein [Flavobacterium sp. Sd200]
MEEYIGMIKIFAGPFIPNGWAECNGQILQIHTADKLYMVIQNTYGGDGMSTFALPDLRGRIPVGLGAQPGGSNYVQGVAGGAETLALSMKHIPSHSHGAKISLSSVNADSGKPEADSVIGMPTYMDGRTLTNSSLYNKAAADVTNTKMISVDTAGEATPTAIDLRQPFIGMRYIICCEGLFPPRG